MKVEVISTGSYQKKLSFSVPATAVKEEFDRAYRDLGTRARLHGFRPGKVPRKVLEARFGDQIKADVASALIQQGYTSALTEHKLEPVGRPQVEDRGDAAPNSEFTFTISVEVRPSVELTQYTGLDVVYPTVEVADDELDRAVKSRLEAQAKLSEVTDRAVKAGDMVIAELVLRDGESEVAREPGTMIRTEGDPYYPGVDAFLVGMNVGDEKSGDVTFPATARTEAVAGRTLTATAKVVSIQATEVPALTDDVAKELGFEGGADGMKTAVRLQLLEGRESMARNQARANLLQALINANTFSVPPSMVESHLQMLLEELKLQQAYRGRDPRKMQYSPEQIADLRIRAEFAAKGGLILEYVSNKESLGVTDEDLERKYQELADQRGQTVEAIRGYFVKDGAVEELRSRLLEEKTLDWLLERAKIVSTAPEQALAGTTAPAEEAVVEKPKKKKAAAAAAPAEEPPSAEEAAPEGEAAEKPKKKKTKKATDEASSEG